MLIRKIIGKCPDCGETVSLIFSDVEIVVIDDVVRISFECPSCNFWVANEELDQD